jgi:L-lysine 6-transaminase
MISFGKKTQVCGFMAGKRIEEVPENVFKVASRINSTWGGGLVDMVRSQKYLEIIHEDKLVENAAKVGEHLQLKLKGLADEFPALVSNVRGRGLYCAFDLPDSETRNKVRAEAYKQGLVILGSGPLSMRFRPPLVITAEQVDEGVGMIRKALAGVKG